MAEGLEEREKYLFHAQIWKNNSVNWERTANECKANTKELRLVIRDMNDAAMQIYSDYELQGNELIITQGKLKNKNREAWIDKAVIVGLLILLGSR